MTLYLYTRIDCPLCDEAATLAMSQQVDLKYIDISENLELLTQFRDIIPVIEHPVSKKRLCWPFTAQQINDLNQTNLTEG